MIRNVLSIAGSDPSGGAGVQADLKTFAAFGCYGMAAVTALTVQNTRGVEGVHTPPPAFAAAQVAAVLADIRVDAIKIGMLASGAIARAIADVLRARAALGAACPIVLDPVLVATSGDALATPDLVEGLRCLYPLATLLTPNLPEAEALTGERAPADAALRLQADGARAVLVKGGHADGPEAVDTLFVAGALPRSFAAPRLDSTNTHGTGCTLSAAIAALLAQGADLGAAIEGAKAYVGAAIAGADALDVGHGHGPLHHGLGR